MNIGLEHIPTIHDCCLGRSLTWRMLISYNDAVQNIEKYIFLDLHIFPIFPLIFFPNTPIFS